MLGKYFSPPDSRKTKEFYNQLMSEDVTRDLWGKEKRFNAQHIANKPSVKDYFLPIIREHIALSDRVLDYGCGSGGFSLAAAPYCREIVGVDISDQFITGAREATAAAGISHAQFICLSPEDALPFADGEFDVLLMVDAIHHFDDPAKRLREALRVLKPNGTLIVFEPNKLNPLLAMMCMLDRNEWGLLPLGTIATYRRMLTPYAVITEAKFNGLLIGPESRLATGMAAMLNHPRWHRLLGWLNPKLYVIAKKI
jgi:SAM-dependent methyltransferase